MLFHSYVRESTESFFWHPVVFVCFVLRLSHISNGLWLLMELFHGKLIRDETKICRQHILGSLQ